MASPSSSSMHGGSGGGSGGGGSAHVHHPPGIQRSQSQNAVLDPPRPPGIENRNRRLSLTTTPSSSAPTTPVSAVTSLRLAHPASLTSMSPPPNKQLRLDPTFLINSSPVQLASSTETAFVHHHPHHQNHQLAVDAQGFLLDGLQQSSSGHRPARNKKLTPKGFEYHQTISHKNDGQFRIPAFPEAFINGAADGAGSAKINNSLPNCSTSSAPNSAPPSYSCGTSNNLNDNGNGELPVGGVSVSSLLKTVPSSFTCVNLTPAGPTHD